jgi:CelD/BcsL family acetyltransferase involved in cellulose biosynthesis
MSIAIRVRRIEERRELAALQNEWAALLARSDVGSPFLTPGWQGAWLKSYGRTHQLWVLAAYRGEELRGLWPLARVRRGLHRVLEPIGAGRSDWLDVLTTAADRDAVFAAFVNHLLAARDDWDLIELCGVLGNSPSFTAFEAAARGQRLFVRHQPRTVSMQLPLAGGWTEFLRDKGIKFRSNLKYYQHRAERLHPAFRITRHEWRKGDRVVDDLADVELRSWKAREGNLKISTDVGREFYRRFCNYFAGRGELDLWRADGSGKLLAFLINVRHGGKVYHYNTCFDEAAAGISPGLLLHAQAIQDAFARGLSEYDFLSGDELYKKRWCPAQRTIEHLALYHDGPRSHIAFFQLVGARWQLRRSDSLRQARQQLITLARRMQRRGGPVPRAARHGVGGTTTQQRWSEGDTHS